MLFKTLTSLFFPKTCACCRTVIDENESFCDYCYSMLEPCDCTKLCLKCGHDKKFCVCKNRVFHFDLAAAPYYNTGIARKAFYSFKFNRNEALAIVFARQMALTLRQVYSDENFDFITFVPMSKSRERKLGYNPVLLLAERLSDLVDIPVKDVLKCHKKKRPQHKLKDYKKRFDNVAGIYYTDKRLSSKRILLIDDIKTTGATLDECAKQLYSAGADRVCCLTALMTSRKRGKKNVG